MPDEELAELAQLHEAQGLSRTAAAKVAEELTAHDALRAHAQIELGIDPDHHANPWAAALASMTAFAIGSVLPLLAIALPPVGLRIPITFIAVIASLSVTGWVGARLGGASPGRAIISNVAVSVVTMVVTYLIGSLVGANITSEVKPRNCSRGFTCVSDTGIEPATSSVSGKRATAAPIAQTALLFLFYWSYFTTEVATGFEPVWTALQAAASPLGHATMVGSHTLLTSQRETSLERMTRFELATPTLARLCATTAPHPHAAHFCVLGDSSRKLRRYPNQ